MAGESKTREYKIGQAAGLIGVEPYVLRYWESEFPQLSPCRRPSGQRYYTDQHLALIQRIKELLYEEKLTIQGAKLRLEQTERMRTILEDIRTDLQGILDEFKNKTS